jgi:hypothetical protein
VTDGEKQTTYVWFDALPNYLAATGSPNPDFEKLWPADLHVIGKDITRIRAHLARDADVGRHRGAEANLGTRVYPQLSTAWEYSGSPGFRRE